ncbi:MAG: hypothetical protein N4A45_10445 [Flavobacteriales bacterium]|jgi:hypothetical protein|nr:hypothetical protein [Flavobacteriales bacterium]
MAFVKLDREYFNSPFWNEERVYSKAEAWLDLLEQARFEASTELINGKAIELEIGEIPVSIRYLEKRWKWGNTKVRNFMKLLIKQRYATQRTTQGQSLLSVTKSEVNKKHKEGDNTPNNTSATHRQHNDNTKEKNIRSKELKKVIVEKEKKKRKTFSPPSLSEIENYFFEKSQNTEFSKTQAERFFHFYQSNNWKVGKNKMANWKSAVSNWINRQKEWEKKEKSSAKKEKETKQQRYGRQTIDTIEANADPSKWGLGGT